MADRDALVVGGSLAGLSAALGLRRSGFRVRVLEQSTERPRRVCGAFLSPEACGYLDWMGLRETARARGADCRSARLCLPGGGPHVWPLERSGLPGMAIRRADLERVLRQACEGEGVQILDGLRVTGWSRGERGEWRVAVQGAAEPGWSSRVLVAADGRFSAAGSRGRKGAGWFGWNAEFDGAGAEPGTLSLYLTRSGYVGLLGFADGKMNVCGLARTEYGEDVAASRDRILQEASMHPALRDLFSRATPAQPWRGVGPLPYGSYARSAPGVFLAGDAAGVGDPFMGEGIARALAAGPMLFEAFSDGASPDAAWPKYADAWSARYGKRQKWGGALRWLLRGRGRLALGAALLRNASVRGWILAASHSVAR